MDSSGIVYHKGQKSYIDIGPKEKGSHRKANFQQYSHIYDETDDATGLVVPKVLVISLAYLSRSATASVSYSYVEVSIFGFSRISSYKTHLPLGLR
jgi:hypothetical protein